MWWSDACIVIELVDQYVEILHNKVTHISSVRMFWNLYDINRSKKALKRMEEKTSYMDIVIGEKRGAIMPGMGRHKVI